MRWLSITTKILAIVRNSEEMVQKIWVELPSTHVSWQFRTFPQKKAYFFNCLVLLTENWYYQLAMGHFLPSGLV